MTNPFSGRLPSPYVGLGGNGQDGAPQAEFEIRSLEAPTLRDSWAADDQRLGWWERLRRRLRAGRSGSRPQMSSNTRFFRNYPQLLAVAEVVGSLWPPRSTLDVIHLGGSIGCEALSLIIAMNEHQPNYRLRSWSTDVDETALSYGRRLAYHERWFEPILGEGGDPGGLRAKWFTVLATREGRVYVPRSELTRDLQFERLDVRRRNPDRSADIVFCQNVLIHMTPRLALRCLRHALAMLRTPGLFVCGGMDLDLRCLIGEAGFRPVAIRIHEIHDAWASHRFHFRTNRGRYYFELEDLDMRRPDWTTRYCSIFAKGRA